MPLGLVRVGVPDDGTPRGTRSHECGKATTPEQTAEQKTKKKTKKKKTKKKKAKKKKTKKKKPTLYICVYSGWTEGACWMTLLCSFSVHFLRLVPFLLLIAFVVS